MGLLTAFATATPGVEGQRSVSTPGVPRSCLPCFGACILVPEVGLRFPLASRVRRAPEVDTAKA